MDSDLKYVFVKPDNSLDDFVDGFWLLQNQSNMDKEVVILPDGRIDLIISESKTEPFHITLLGLETQFHQAKIISKQRNFAISFKPLAAEFLFSDKIANLRDKGLNLQEGFWDFHKNDLNDFGIFQKKASQKIQSLVPERIDDRKRQLFELIYDCKGELTVQELSEKVYWDSRQINRYFNQRFGVSLKTYCNIIRFRFSFQNIKEGKLFPEQKFADQSHFIKEVKKHSGVSPKELNKNIKDRFLQFSLLK